MNRSAPLLALALGFLSCNDHSPAHSQRDLSAESTLIISEEKQVPPPHQQDTIVYDELIYPSDTLFPGKVLTTGFFHEDEVWPGAEKEMWWGLFKKNSGYYLAKAQLEAKRIHDPVLVDDPETDSTGWEISTTSQDTSIILMSGLAFLSERKVERLVLPKEQVFPGDTLTFYFGDQRYRLFASGGSKKVRDEPEWREVWNYKLYLSTERNGKTITQLLVAQPHFDDDMIDIIFAGDIDGDGLPDLILDTSGNYNATSPTLYLSRPAAGAKLIEIAGMHTSVGC